MGRLTFGPKCATSLPVDLLTLSSATTSASPVPPVIPVNDSALTLPGLFNLLFQIEIEQAASDGEWVEDREGFSRNSRHREKEGSEAPSNPSGVPVFSPLPIASFVAASFEVNPGGEFSESSGVSVASGGVPIPDRDPNEHSDGSGSGQRASLTAPFISPVQLLPSLSQVPGAAGAPSTHFGNPGGVATKGQHGPSAAVPAEEGRTFNTVDSVAPASLAKAPAPVRFDLTPIRDDGANGPVQRVDSRDATTVDLPVTNALSESSGHERRGAETSSGKTVIAVASSTADPEGGESPPRDPGDDSRSPAPPSIQVAVSTPVAPEVELPEASATSSPAPERQAPSANLAPEESGPPAPPRVSAIAIQVPGREGTSVGLLVRSGGERIEMALSTADPFLSRELRGQLPLLAANIEKHGYELHPSPSAGFEQNGLGGEAGQRSRHREQRQQPPSRQKAARRTNQASGVSS